MTRRPLLFHSTQIRQIETQAIAALGDETLMRRAGEAAFNLMQTQFQDIFHITVLCGMGNNGGDGLVVAALAQSAGIAVKVILFGDSANQTELAQQMFYEAQDIGVEVESYQTPLNIDETDLIIDALLGVGAKGKVRQPMFDVIAKINNGNVPVFSLDTPSGMDPDTGQANGIAVVADATITFIAAKLGLVTGVGKHLTGELFVNDLGLEEFIEQFTVDAEYIDQALMSEQLPLPDMHAHKGVMGHVVIVGGDTGMPGAVSLAAEAALRVGAGKATIITREANFEIVLNARREFICCVAEDDWHDAKQVLATADACVVGPGMIDSDWSRTALTFALNFQGPKVIDAGGLRLLNNEHGFLNNSIITPHPGEAASMLAVSTQVVEQDRYASADKLTTEHAEVVVLKGAGTLIKSGEYVPKVCALGNPGMATAGMGDVLAGMIGGLAAQLSDLLEAATAGVVLHAHIGDIAAEEIGQASLLAGDMFDFFAPGMKQANEAWVLESE